MEIPDLPETSNSILSIDERHRLPSALLNVLSNWGGFVCASAISFFLSPFVVHHLGNASYGIWVLIGSLTGYLGLLNLGVRAAVMRYVARFHLEANDQEASAVASSALAIFLLTGTLAFLLSLIFAALVVGFFHIPQSLQFESRAVVILGGCTIAVSLVSAVFGGIVTALHRFDLMNAIEVVSSFLSATTIVLLLSAGKGLIGLAAVNFVFAILTGLAYMLVALRIYPTLRIRLEKCDWHHLKVILAFGVHSLLLQISFNLIFYSDSLVIGVFLSINLITFFAIAANLMNYSRMLISGISATMTPRASALESRGGRQEVLRFLMKATRLATLVILPIAVTFLLRGRSFIGLWMGHEYGEQSGRVLWILALALVFVAGNQVAISTMMGIGKHRPVVLVVCCEALCNLSLSVVLVRPFGIFGVAWGTALPSLAVSLLFWPWYIHSTLGISARDYVISTWFRPAIAVVPYSVLTWWIERFWPAQNVMAFFLQVGAILPTVGFVSWYTCFNHSEREVFAQRWYQSALRILR